MTSIADGSVIIQTCTGYFGHPFANKPTLTCFHHQTIKTRPCNSCISSLNKHLLFSELGWIRLLFSELAWNISEFSKAFLVSSCSFHCGVTMEFSICCAVYCHRGIHLNSLLSAKKVRQLV